MAEKTTITAKQVQDLSLEELKTFVKGVTELLVQKISEEDTLNLQNSSKMDTQTQFTTVTHNKKRKTDIRETQKASSSTQAVVAIRNGYDALTTEENTDKMEEDEIANSDPADKSTRQNTVKIAPKTPKIVPIVLREKDKWMKTSNLIKSNKIAVTKSKVVATGIQIEPATEDDFRNLRSLLKKENLQHYTYELKSEKKLKVVIRGIQQEITIDEIMNDLKDSGYPAEKITRMNGKFNRPAPMVLVQIGKLFKSIYNLKYCCGLSVTVEPLMTKSEVIQCHRCQLFGHTQPNCEVEFKCMKCGDYHSTHECEKPRTTPPRCANCGGEHLSTSLKCLENPNNPNHPNNPLNRRKQLAAPIPTENPWFRNKPEYQKPEPAIEEKKTKDNPKRTDQDELALILGKMMLNLVNTKATEEQKREFFNYTEQISSLFNKTAYGK